MALRRGPPVNTNYPQDALSPNSQQSPVHPRSASPSGLSQFLTRPSKWFSRSASASKAIPGPSTEPRPSLGSGGRKHKISRPTDPRPILETYNGVGARSVVDLSAMSPAHNDAPSLPASPSPRGGGGLGDLRNISRKGWSRSADDLTKINTANLSPAQPSFQEKITEYRNRSGSNASAISPATPISAVSVPGGGIAHHPFPSFGTTPPLSSSPPRSMPNLPPPISISSPSGEEAASPRTGVVSPGQNHVHIRSHSFTPKLPSKLATPRFPQSPQRGGSHDQDFEVRDVDRTQGTPTRAAFGFGFGGLNPKGLSPIDTAAGPSLSPSSAAGNRQTTLLPPPTIIEPDQPFHDEPESHDPRRASQIVFCSSFINRLADLPANFQQHYNHGNLALSKGWKPFKLELKGSKLYFYKPPSDRTTGIKELFPTSLVPPSLEEDDTEQYGHESSSSLAERDGMSPRPKTTRQDSNQSTAGRKKRAFWGRRTHPDLIRDPKSGEVEKGTFEALVHEAVFATTFLGPSVTSEEDIAALTEDEKHEKKLAWHDFASSIILSIPLIISGGQQVFEGEFLRCCSYLVSGAEESIREQEISRVAWLANEYMRFHGQAADTKGWESWKNETIPGISLSAESATLSSSSLTASTSTQAIYQPSPSVGSNDHNDSPNLPAFSPRPEDGKISLLDALSSPIPRSSPQLQHQQSPQYLQGKASGLAPHPGNRFPWTALFEEGLTRDLLLRLDPHLIAKSLTLFHRSILERSPENVTAEFVMNGNIQEDISGSQQGILEKEPSTHLFGSNDQPHWLTKLLLLQILGSDTSSGHSYMPSGNSSTTGSTGRRSDDRGPQTSRTHSRSEVISVWTKIGEICRRNGDECSWRAIASALCSRPVARLDKVWKRVDPQAFVAVERWSLAASTIPVDKSNALHEEEEDHDIARVSVGHPQVTPWGGDVKSKFTEELNRANGETMVMLQPIGKARRVFEEFKTSFSLCPRKVYVDENELDDDVKRLVGFWGEMAAEGGRKSGLAVKFQRVEQFMSLSLAAEPRRKGLFEPHFWTRLPSSNAPFASLVPLLFPDPLPTLTLVDRSQLVRARVDSDASEQQYLRSLDAQLRQEAGRMLHDHAPEDFTKKLILGHGGTDITVYNGDLVVVTQSGGFESIPNSRPTSSRAPSRPESSIVDHTGTSDRPTMSRNPSIRVKPSSSHGLDRKTSMARRSSLPTVSHLSRANFVTVEPSSEPPLRVLVKSGTLNALVGILVHGLENISVSVADDNGEMTLEGMTRELVLDRVEFARVWWNVFRSFVSPFVFFELLRKIFISAQPSASTTTPTDHFNAVKKRTEVLNAAKEWLTVGGGAQDVLDDPQLFAAVDHFLESSLDLSSILPDFPPVQSAQASQIEAHRALQFAFSSQIQRPAITRGLHTQSYPGGNRNPRKRNMVARDPPDLDRMDIEEFVDNLDGMAAAAFANVTQEDLYITADLLEIQSADRTGWFSPRELSTSEELVEIQSIYSHLQEVEPSSLISELSQDSLYRLLPPGVRSCIRAFSIVRKWIISKLVASRIGLRARQARIELLIQAIELARLRNTETPSSAQLIEQPCVRSFVEAVTTSALLSVESRLHHRAWQSVATGRNCSCDSLSSLLHRPFVQSTSSQESLTVDMGWLLERMIEIIAKPDIVEPTSQESQQLVNFDKRRNLCNLINKASCIPSARRPTTDEANRRGFERLNKIEKEVMMMQFDHRGIKEEALREAANPGMNGTPSSKKTTRPFQKVVAIQIEKNRRDKHLRTRLQREKQQEQARSERRDDALNKAMRPRKPAANGLKQHRNKKSMSVFLNLMRPISSAFGAEMPHIVPKKSAAELDFPTTSKPSLVVNVLDAKVAQFINNERSYTFQLDTEDGGHYLLQTTTKREMTRWLETISKITNMAAKRRLTYLGNSPKPQIADHIHSHPIVASRDPKAVFGVELEFLLRRESERDSIAPDAVPAIIEQCLSEIETRGLSEVGIYRIAGATTEINGLKEAYNRGELPIRPTTDIHAICDLVKSWFRLLPEPLFPPDSYHNVMEAMRIENLDERLVNIRHVVQALPQPNFNLLRRVSEHLDKVTDFEEHNHMTAEALAIVFSPNLLRAPQNDFVMILNNMGLSHKLVKALITHFQTIFDEADPEAEPPSEDEMESPILEEDEEEEEDAADIDEHQDSTLLDDSHYDTQQPINTGMNYTLP
ncbi:hypothetical protein CPB83DRAFT_862338 [Crepidotus variabilis]|uniref:Uncharacterized protein n=1 Tax=Crepidotus variabilis TaxID=179855 RepID=A0A9P6JK82_9AGAR|nr:hypothetical protein CPB83DRAFT_862338 [Crepidotus variabilis]